jgi:hypothetical protein
MSRRSPVVARLPEIRMPRADSLRAALLLAIAVDFGLIASHILHYSRLLDMPGSALYIIEPAVMLLAYVALWLWLTSAPAGPRRAALSLGLVFGALTGVMEMVDITLETFVDLSGAASILATAPLLLGAFALWCVAGFVATWRTGSRGAGIVASVASAMTCMLIAIAFGLLLGFTSLPRLLTILRFDPDYLRSGWRDLHAFAIANQFDAAFSHLLGALIVGGIMGIIGGTLSYLAGRRIRR